MVQFLSEAEESLINSETDKIVAMLQKCGSTPDRDMVYNEVICYHLPKDRW